jgi:hypothetical protein
VGERGGAWGGEEKRAPQRNSPKSVVCSPPPRRDSLYRRMGGGLASSPRQGGRWLREGNSKPRAPKARADLAGSLLGPFGPLPKP